MMRIFSSLARAGRRRGCARLRAALVLVVALAVPCSAQKSESALLAKLATQSLLLDVAAAGARLVAVGVRGHVLLSDDEGVTWRQAQEVPTRVMLTAVFFHDGRVGWAVGHDSVILRTDDGGERWKKVYSDPEASQPLFDVFFRDASNGIAVGAYGLVLKSADGGLTWRSDLIGEMDWHLNAIAAAEDGHLYLAAEAGNVYRSADSGVTWDELSVPYDGSLFGAVCLDRGVVLVFGLRGHLFRSEDGGDTWQQLVTGTHALLKGGAVSANGSSVVVVGSDGAVLVSGDGGRRFQLHQRSDRQVLTKFLFVDQVSGVVVGDRGPERLELTVGVGGAPTVAKGKRVDAKEVLR